MTSLEHSTASAGHNETVGPHFLTDPTEREKYHEARKRRLGAIASEAGVIRRPGDAHTAHEQALHDTQYHIPVDPEAPKL